MNGFFENMFENINISGGIIALVLCAVSLLALVSLFIWEKRADKQLTVLESIRSQLEESSRARLEEMKSCDEDISQAEYSPFGESTKAEAEEITADEEIFNRGKSGKIYTQEEIEALIRD